MYRFSPAGASACLALTLFLAAGAVTPSAAQHAARSAPAPWSVLLSPVGAAYARAERLVAPFARAQVALLQERQTYRWSDDAVGWELDARSIFTYDDIYRTEETQYVWSGAEWDLTGRVTYSGNAANDPTGTFAWDAEAGDYVPVDRTVYNYAYDLFTGEMLIADETYQTWDGQAYVNVERTVYEIGEQFAYTSLQTDLWDGSAWVPSQRQTILEEDERVVYVYEEWAEGAWTPVDRISFASPSRKELQDDLKEAAAAAGRYEEALYLIHLLPPAESESWDGQAWVPEARQTVYYEMSTGRKLYVEEEEWENGTWTATGRLVFEYAEDGSLAALAWDESDGEGGWSTLLREQYAWDEMGSITSAWTTADLGGGVTAALRHDYFWRYTGSSTGGDETPASFRLDPAYPNPFNPATRLSYTIAEAGPVAVRVFDAMGREVAVLFEGVLPAGTYEATFDGGALPSGTYLIRLETAQGRSARAVTLLK